jgi:fructosamine-3-kinase
MSRTGIEDKPPWRQVPKAVRQQVEQALGQPVRRAARVWGGYGPTPTYRLALADGRRAFFKATYQASNEFARCALVYEERVYQELSAILAGWMPQCYATFHHEDWHVMLLADLGPKSVPPWTPGKARAISQALAAFHHSTLGVQAPSWLARPAEWLPRENWSRTRDESENFYQLARLATEAVSEAQNWFQTLSPTIERLLKDSALTVEPYALLHGDLRSDNLRFTGGQLYLFDWPAISVGRPEWDMAAFAQSVVVEGGPTPEQVMSWYGEKFPVDPAALESALAWCLTFFANRAWRPDSPGLPRVRRFQRQQLAALMFWAARQWSLPPPTWAEPWLT